MKKNLIIATIIIAFLSCNSNKTEDENKSTGVNDSLSVNIIDTTDQTSSVTLEPDLNKIGELSLGMNMASTIEKIGEPDTKSKAEVWGADGWLYQEWEYKTKGISLNMGSEQDPSAMVISSITITSPCTFKTDKKMGIGNTYNEVMTAYEKDIDKESSNKNSIVAGTLYGGIIFTFKDDKVVKIFVGAAAE